jgi:uncharacterized protein YueI
VILESEAADEAVSSFYLVIGTSIRLDLCEIMLKKRLYSTVLLKIKEKKVAKTENPWHANREQHFTCGWNKR